MPRFQGIIEDENPLRPGICVKHFLSFPQKNLWPEKTETNQVFTFQFLNDRIYSYTKKSNLALGNLAKLIFWSILSFKNWSFVKLLSFLWQFFWWEVNLRGLGGNIKYKISACEADQAVQYPILAFDFVLI